jgi:hypothetical protein
MFELDAGYPTSGFFRPGMYSSVHQIATENAKTSTAEVIFLDAPGRIAEACSGDVSEDNGLPVRNHGVYLTQTS